MRYRITEDPFKYNQPRVRFADELTSPMHQCAPAGWNTRKAQDGEISICGRMVIAEFPDSKNLLETAYADLQRFFEVYKMQDGNKCHGEV